MTVQTAKESQSLSDVGWQSERGLETTRSERVQSPARSPGASWSPSITAWTLSPPRAVKRQRDLQRLLLSAVYGLIKTHLKEVSPDHRPGGQ